MTAPALAAFTRRYGVTCALYGSRARIIAPVPDVGRDDWLTYCLIPDCRKSGIPRGHKRPQGATGGSPFSVALVQLASSNVAAVKLPISFRASYSTFHSGKR